MKTTVQKTAFITKYGLFEHVRLPFGLCNSPATFSRAIQLVLQGLTWKECLAYLDDVIVMGENFSSHMRNLRSVLTRFQKYNLKLNPKKCNLFQTEIKFLGKIVNSKGISINPESIDTVKNWPEPKCKKEVESFLGFANYHRDHISQFAKLAEPLHETVKNSKKTQFIWSNKQEQSFQNLKIAIINAVSLDYPSPSPEDVFILDTDASDKSIGAELIQVQNGQEKIISFASKVLTSTQRKYCTTRELLAVIVFTRQFRHFLLGRHFILRTDHNSLTWLLSFKNIEGQLARWIEELSQYNITIQHRSGIKHSNADGLSRIPDKLDGCQGYMSGVALSKLPCGGCAFCTRARNQWQTFEDDIDYVVPLAIRSLEKVTLGMPSELHHKFSQDYLQEAQSSDGNLKILIEWIEHDYTPSQQELSLSSNEIKYFWSCKSQLHMVDKLLYYKWEDPVNPRYLFVVPDKLKEEIFKYCHDALSAGHLGQNKTLEKIKQCAIWHGLSTDCSIYVKQCSVCNRNKKTNIKARSALGQYHVGAPMQRLHMDILGPLPLTKHGNKYILVVIDQFTKWVECFPLPCQNAEIIAKTLIDGFISRFGVHLKSILIKGKT